MKLKMYFLELFFRESKTVVKSMNKTYALDQHVIHQVQQLIM